MPLGDLQCDYYIVNGRTYVQTSRPRRDYYWHDQPRAVLTIPATSNFTPEAEDYLQYYAERARIEIERRRTDEPRLHSILEDSSAASRVGEAEEAECAEASALSDEDIQVLSYLSV